MIEAGVPVGIPAHLPAETAYAEPNKFTWWWVMQLPDGFGFGQSDRDIPDEQQDAMEEAMSGSGPGLVIDGRDYSRQYVACVNQTGYDDELARRPNIPDSRTDSRAIARQVEVNNQWTQCAREHGFPDIADTTPKWADDESPTIFIPYTMNPDQLRQLLNFCPNFDPDKHKAWDELVRSTPRTPITELPDFDPDPSITLDRVEIAGLSQADFDRMQQLYDLIAERSLEHQNSLDTGR
jgi:hypothetical protein